jgi:superoxide dismutase, Cu-Zn family
MRTTWVLVGLCAALSACGHTGTFFQRNPGATAVLQPTKGNQTSGTVQFTQKGSAVLVEARVSGLAPNALHGFHIHEKGDCSAPDASSAGGHFNPGGMPHGAPQSEQRHGGDLGNLAADSSGFAHISMEVSGVTLGADANSVIGRAVIVHAQPDDLRTQPTGNAGARIACGLISKNPDKFF